MTRSYENHVIGQCEVCTRRTAIDACLSALMLFSKISSHQQMEWNAKRCAETRKRGLASKLKNLGTHG